MQFKVDVVAANLAVVMQQHPSQMEKDKMMKSVYRLSFFF